MLGIDDCIAFDVAAVCTGFLYALSVADNMIRPGGEDVRRYGEAIRARPGISSVLLPVGSGLEVSRFDRG